jgi:hypothetical protein
MNKWGADFALAGMLLFAAPCIAGAAFADNSSPECNLSGASSDPDMPPCPTGTSGGINISTVAVGTSASTPGVTQINYGARSDANVSALVPINTWASCNWVDNKGNDSFFVPFKSQTEWTAFINGKPADISVVNCVLPDNGASLVDPNYDPSCTSQRANNPNVYGRPGNSSVWSVWPVPPTSPPSSPPLGCHSGATSIQSQLQWNTKNASVWQPNFKYSPDLTLTATDNVTGIMATGAVGAPPLSASAGDMLTLNWAILSDGPPAMHCDAYDGCPGDGWAGPICPTASFPSCVSGTKKIPSLCAGDFKITCTGQGLTPVDPTLTSTAIVGLIDTGLCGADGYKALAGAPVNLCSAASAVAPSSLVSTSTGWNWTCIPQDGGTGTACCSSFPAQCGTGVTVDPSTGATTGTLCTAGTPSSVGKTTGSYFCTMGVGACSNIADCTANTGTPQTCNTVVTSSLTVPSVSGPITVNYDMYGGGGGAAGGPWGHGGDGGTSAIVVNGAIVATAAGGAGAADNSDPAGNGMVGAPGQNVSGSFIVNSGDIMSVYVGGGGGGGPDFGDANSAHGGGGAGWPGGNATGGAGGYGYGGPGAHAANTSAFGGGGGSGNNGGAGGAGGGSYDPSYYYCDIVGGSGCGNYWGGGGGGGGGGYGGGGGGAGCSDLNWYNYGVNGGNGGNSGSWGSNGSDFFDASCDGGAAGGGGASGGAGGMVWGSGGSGGLVALTYSSSSCF